ncbi:pectin acetylesterase-family hydrolase [Haliangium ochraceum]|uniref:Pectinacetylesterase n=1 Tax=Haliangium ochraceum (strain DSM 14365 / JCM 11303 / SMP-2) TaxID=502025 RepID=D0LJK0_HALO1|nr:pectin acetylesterase-family hydrolase [Haliangium ochraceum]ACY16574.1 conserved hypothetical protein [Haliangium ochraceum DSM 14365]
MKRFVLPAVLAVAMIPASAQAQDLLEGVVDIIVDGGNDYDWQRVELDGAVCGNGSQYKFYVHDTGSPNLLFFLEGGGACWDYDTCSGRAGVLGAANPNGLPDDYMDSFTATYVSPIVNGADPGVPGRSRTELATSGWNIVYLPYCTGDVHVGNNVRVYEDPTGAEPPLTWHHNGYNNTTSAAEYAATLFPNVDKMMVSGYSAGGTATSAAYKFIRDAIQPNRGYLLNDSGPIFLAPNEDSLSRGLHDDIRASWSLDSVFATLPLSFDPADFGSINRMVAEEFPQDQLAYTGYSLDYNYSRFSYERFRTPNDKESVLSYWQEDQDRFVEELSSLPNFSYFIPYGRPINDSHCSTIITFIGAHACQRMEEKHHWWEYLLEPWQSWKCYSEFVPMETFIDRFVNDGQRVRIYEPENYYNNDDPGMSLMAELVNAALGD